MPGKFGEGLQKEIEGKWENPKKVKSLIARKIIPDAGGEVEMMKVVNNKGVNISKLVI